MTFTVGQKPEVVVSLRLYIVSAACGRYRCEIKSYTYVTMVLWILDNLKM